MRRVVFALALLLATPAWARHHGHHGNKGESRDEGGAANAGQFDYYVLSLSWSPGFCAMKHDTSSEQCNGSKHFGFVVHGLWPQYDAGGYPQHCPTYFQLDDALVTSMLDIMPSEFLVHHEWETHGSCSGLKPKDYFALLRRAFAQVHLPAKLQAPHEEVKSNQDQIESMFADSNRGLNGQMIDVECKQVVTEVRFCMTKDLQFRTCGPDVQDHCKGGVFPPVR